MVYNKSKKHWKCGVIMKFSIDCCFFVLESVENENKRKNDIKKLKVLVDKNNGLVTTSFDKEVSLKDAIRNKIKTIIGSDVFHLEQVYTLGETKFYDTGVNVIYLGITNIENVKKLDDKYKLVDFEVVTNKHVLFDGSKIGYNTKVKKSHNNLEYYHDIKTSDVSLEKEIIELLTSYKQIASKMDYTDIMFKFLPKYYTLEDVRIIYEMIKNVSVDKSNFRKKIMKYCKETDKVISDKGYRPTHLYEFVLDENDIWI